MNVTQSVDGLRCVEFQLHGELGLEPEWSFVSPEIEGN
tara:strand:+ start:16858 stop:16971 length:114 start_codon:yes stop_codon:yes gene_type:complete